MITHSLTYMVLGEDNLKKIKLFGVARPVEIHHAPVIGSADCYSISFKGEEDKVNDFIKVLRAGHLITPLAATPVSSSVPHPHPVSSGGTMGLTPPPELTPLEYYREFGEFPTGYFA